MIRMASAEEWVQYYDATLSQKSKSDLSCPEERAGV